MKIIQPVFVRKTTGGGKKDRTARYAGGLTLLGALLLAAGAAVAAHPYDPEPSGELPQAVPDNRLTARFFCVGTVPVSDGRTGVMTDGFFSRPALFRRWRRSGRTSRRSTGRCAGARSRLAHSGQSPWVRYRTPHYDRALDTAAVAGKLPPFVIGSVSTCRIVRPQNIRRVDRRWRAGRDLNSSAFSRYESSGGSTRRHRRGRSARPCAATSIRLQGPSAHHRVEQAALIPSWVEHRGHAVLIHSSTNFQKGVCARRAGGGRVPPRRGGCFSRQGDRFANDYWQEVVAATGGELGSPRRPH